MVKVYGERITSNRENQGKNGRVNVLVECVLTCPFAYLDTSAHLHLMEVDGWLVDRRQSTPSGTLLL
jgi:hypothetical protein